MRRLGVSPKNTDVENKTQTVDNWFQIAGERLNVYQGTADPTAAEIPENQWIVYYNTTSLELRIWSNIAGTVLKSAAFT